jgi:hypothetical protein
LNPLQQLTDARHEVSKHNFGTEAWEAAMATVRVLSEEIRLAAPRREYTSIDGDIFQHGNRA